MKPFLSTCAAIALASIAASASGAEPTPADIAHAKKLFSDATELREEGKYAESDAKLREAIAIKDTPGLRFHLAVCEEKLGHLIEAQSEYDHAQALIDQGVKAADVAELIGPARSALAERIPTLLVRVPAGVRGAAVSVDGQPIAPQAIEHPMELDPGTHSLLVRAADHRDFNLEVTLVEGDDRVVDAVLLPTSSSNDRSAAPPPSSPSSSSGAAVVETSEAAPAKKPSWFGAREAVLLGEGVFAVAGATMGTVFVVKYAQENRYYDAELKYVDSLGSDCSKPVQPNLACTNLGNSVSARQLDAGLALGGFIGAGVGAAAFVTTWLLWPKHHAESASVRVVPGLFGGSVVGDF
ncbi:MAG TPA: hypothetical protein VH142_14185 [Polyangiaceae bacterium]|jgi:hypothetical protein|nr:hypothetical protein [Polyangiaceae bacterium]